MNFTFTQSSTVGGQTTKPSALLDIEVTNLIEQDATLTLTAKLNVPLLKCDENEKLQQFVTPNYTVGDIKLKMRVDVTCKSDRNQQQQIFGPPQTLPSKHHFHYSFFVMTEPMSFSDRFSCYFSSKFFGITRKQLPDYSNECYILIHENNSKPSIANDVWSFDVKFEVEKNFIWMQKYPGIIMNNDSSRFNNMSEDTELLDFELSVEDGSVKVHKFVLAAASPVFKGEFGEKWKDTDRGSLHVPGISKTTLENFRRYLYLRQIPENGCEQLLLLADYYQMRHLERACIQQLVTTISAENYLEQCEFAVEHKLTKFLIALLKQTESGAVKVDDICKSRTSVL